MGYFAKVVALLLMLWAVARGIVLYGTTTLSIVKPPEAGVVDRITSGGSRLDIDLFTGTTVCGLLFASGCLLWVLSDIAYARSGKSAELSGAPDPARL